MPIDNPQRNPWVDMATTGWLSGNQGSPTPDDAYYGSVVPQLHRTYDDTNTSWWQSVMNALGVVAPHLRDLGRQQQYSGPSAPARSTSWRGGGGRWQSPQATPLADWRETPHGLYPRFYGGGYGGLAGAAGYAAGGEVRPAEQYGALQSSRLYRGPGGGQDDELDAKVSPGEYIFNAMDVAMLGDGNNEEGARRLDEMRGALRTHLTSNRDGHPPKARSPLSYLREAA